MFEDQSVIILLSESFNHHGHLKNSHVIWSYVSVDGVSVDGVSVDGVSVDGVICQCGWCHMSVWMVYTFMT